MLFRSSRKDTAVCIQVYSTGGISVACGRWQRALFLKQNKKAKKTTQFAATKSLCDENGDPLLWTIRPLSTKESAAIRDECTIEVPVTGKPGLYRQKVNTDELLRKMICAAVVEPDLHNAELQDSYGVMSAEALIVEMVDNPEEFGELATFVQEYSGIDETLQEKVEIGRAHV